MNAASWGPLGRALGGPLGDLWARCGGLHPPLTRWGQARGIWVDPRPSKSTGPGYSRTEAEDLEVGSGRVP
eukprot:1819587-Pyramimonas_sp.AAC.1